MTLLQALGAATILLASNSPCAHRLHLGPNKFEGTLAGGHSFVAEIAVGPYEKNCNGPADPDSWWGIIDQSPTTILRNLTLHVDTLFVPLPRSAYAFLAEPYCAEVKRGIKGITLVLRGADAGASYTAEFRFVAGHLVERTIRSNEFPEEIFEVTQYVNKAQP